MRHPAVRPIRRDASTFGRMALCLGALAGLHACDGAGDDKVFSPDESVGAVDAEFFTDLDRSGNVSGSDRPMSEIWVGLRRQGTTDTLAFRQTSEGGTVRFGDLPAGTMEIFVDPEPLGDSLVRSYQTPNPLVVVRRDSNPVRVGFSYPIVGIPEARNSAQDRRVFVEGVALNGSNALPGNALHVWADGAWIRAENTTGAGVGIGDSVRVRGSVHRSGGSVVLREGLRASLPGSQDPVSPVSISTAAAHSAQGGLDGALVRIQSATVNQTVFSGGTATSQITDGTGTLMVQIPANHLVEALLPIPVAGGTVQLTGVLVPQSGGSSWILRTRAGSDVSISSTGTMAGRVFVDNDDSGDFTSGDEALAGVRVSARASQIGGSTIEEGVTGADGRFQLDGLPTGPYQIELDPFSYPASLSLGSISPSPIPITTNQQTQVAVPLRPPSGD